MLTAFLLATNVPLTPLYSIVTFLPDKFLNLGVAASAGYSLFYALLDPLVGSFLTPFLIASSLVCTDLVLEYGYVVDMIAIGIFVACWILQFIGHGVYEKRAPALFQNMLQALVLAPFFVAMEVMFKFGVRKNLEKRVQRRVLKNIEDFNKTK